MTKPSARKIREHPLYDDVYAAFLAEGWPKRDSGRLTKIAIAAIIPPPEKKDAYQRQYERGWPVEKVIRVTQIMWDFIEKDGEFLGQTAQQHATYLLADAVGERMKAMAKKCKTCGKILENQS